MAFYLLYVATFGWYLLLLSLQWEIKQVIFLHLFGSLNQFLLLLFAMVLIGSSSGGRLW
jgi:hypothetical protein